MTVQMTGPRSIGRARRTVLLTGASGVVGRALLPRLRDFDVVCLVHRSPVSGPNVTAVPGVRAASRSVEGPLTFTVSYEVSASPAGTTLRYHLTAASGLGGAFGRALEPIVQRAQTKVVRANLGTLASLLEQRAA